MGYKLCSCWKKKNIWICCIFFYLKKSYSEWGATSISWSQKVKPKSILIKNLLSMKLYGGWDLYRERVAYTSIKTSFFRNVIYFVVALYQLPAVRIEWLSHGWWLTECGRQTKLFTPDLYTKASPLSRNSLISTHTSFTHNEISNMSHILYRDVKQRWRIKNTILNSPSGV